MFSFGKRCVVLAIAGGMLAGCASQKEIKARIAGRWGPNPTIEASEFNSTAQNQMTVLYFLANDAGIGEKNSEGHYVPTTAEQWFNVAKWGFNVGRQDCEIYIDNLFRMSRERQRNDSLLNAVSVATQGILTATTRSQLPVSIVGQAFGMTTKLNDALFDSYLFTEAPGLVGNKIAELQATYSQDVGSNKSAINGSADAYAAIHTYYGICLPHSIEGILLQKIADSSSKGSTGNNGQSNGKKSLVQSNGSGAFNLMARPKLQ